MSKQRTFDGELVESGKHPEDLVVCKVTGKELRLADAYLDCLGNAYVEEEDRDDADADIVSEIIEARDAQTVDYTESDDYAGNYYDLIGDRAEFVVRDWLVEEGYSVASARKIAPDILTVINIDAHHQGNEYAAYYGSGLVVDSFPVGEVEDQIDLADHPELKRLHDAGRLDVALARYRGNAFVYEPRSGGYVRHGSFMYISSAGGCWHFVIPVKRLRLWLRENNLTTPG